MDIDIHYEGRLVVTIWDGRAHLHPDIEFGDGRVAGFVFAMAAYALNPDRIADGMDIEEATASSWLAGC